MPKEPREYSAAYARRLAYGEAHGRTRAESRGHGSKTQENAQRVFNAWVKKSSGGVPVKEYRAAMKREVERKTKAEGKFGALAGVTASMREKVKYTKANQDLVNKGYSWNDAAIMSGARERYEDRDMDAPIENYYYHSD